MSSNFDIQQVISASKTDSALQHEIEQFYYREALLLDNIFYEDWFALLDEDIHYFMPIRRNVMKRGRVRDTDVSEYTNIDEFAHFDDDINTCLLYTSDAADE